MVLPDGYDKMISWDKKGYNSKPYPDVSEILDAYNNKQGEIGLVPI